MASYLSTFFQCRQIATSANLYGKRNFRKFNLYGKRGNTQEKRLLKKKRDPVMALQHDRGIKPVGYYDEDDRFHIVPEMIPDMIVPDLTDFKLKPYVSYKVPDIDKSEFTPQDLFYAVYANKIKSDFDHGLLDKNGCPEEPSPEEELTAEEAENNARKCGNDIFG